MTWVLSVGGVPRRWPITTTSLALTLAAAHFFDMHTRVHTGLGPEALPARWVFDGAHPRIWQLVTYAFVHADDGHLRANVVALALAGLCVEWRLGARVTAMVALWVTVAACVGFYALDARDLYGASGAVAGLVALAGTLWVGDRNAHPVTRALVTVGVVMYFGVSEALPALLGHPGAGWHVHLPGALAGALVGLAWRWRHRSRVPWRIALDRATLAAVLAVVGGGFALGFGVLHPFLAWVGIALTAYGLSLDAAQRPRAWALLVGGLIACTLRLDFLWHGFCAYMPPHAAHRWAAGIIVGVSLVERAPTLLVSRVWRRAPAFVPLWLPPALLCGEWLWARATHLPLDAWMLTQGRTTPVLHVIAWLGYVPTALLALALASCVGASCARIGRARGVGLALCTLVAALACVVPARRRGTAALRGVVALRLNRFVGELAPVPGAELVVWPETTVRWPLAITHEGAVEGVHLPRLMRGSDPAEHIVGTLIRLPGQRYNAAVVIGPDGDARWMRAKRRLMPVGETPFLGAMLSGVQACTAGSVVPVTRVAGRTVGVLICLELFDREQVERATGAGVELLAVPAGDTIVGHTAVGRELMVSVSALVAAERGVAVARSAWRGVSVLIGPDGAVIARADAGHLHHVAWIGR